MTRILTVSLVTLGDPGRLTGGYRYHRRIAELAPAGGATGRFVCLPDRVGAENLWVPESRSWVLSCRFARRVVGQGVLWQDATPPSGTAAVTGKQVPRCIASRHRACAGISAPARTSTDASPNV
jgi:hypothetical protein